MTDTDLSYFTVEDLSRLIEGATASWRISMASIAGIPPPEVPVGRKLHIEELEKKLALYRAELAARTRPPTHSAPLALPLGQPAPAVGHKIVILFVSSEPTNVAQLRVGQEQRDIGESLQRANLREHFQLAFCPSARPTDLSQSLLDFGPRIVHFSGHGSSNGALYMEDASGLMHPVSAEALQRLFALFANRIDCVLLNACYAEIQARAISTHIRYVIGMRTAITDAAALRFSLGFYQALGAGRSIPDAFEFGCVQIQMYGLPEAQTPVLIQGGGAPR